ncbi:MAG: hypothetical protein AAF196_09000 [Planctomycetota bacterium]
MALIENVERKYVLASRRKVGFKVKGGARIFRGAALSKDANGFVEPLTGTTGFTGFAVDEIDATDLADGEVEIEVYVEGDVELELGDNIDGSAAGAVEASDDDTFRLGGAIVGNPIGKIVKATDATRNRVLVHFEATGVQSL